MKRAFCIAAALMIVTTGAAQAQASVEGNGGGVLVVHTSNVVYTSDDVPNYPGGSGITCGKNFPPWVCADQEDCSSEILTLNPTSSEGTGGVPTVFYVMAAFPPENCPRLAGVTFGISYDFNVITVADQGHTGDFELADASWPFPTTGTAVTWDVAQKAQLNEVYWFAAYAYYTPGNFSIIAHPAQGGGFADDTIPAVENPIEGYGVFGLGGSVGSNPDTVSPVLESTWGAVKKIFSENE